MNTDIMQLDSSYNLTIFEHRVRLNTVKFKNKNRFKHDDILFLPKIEQLNKIIETLTQFPKRFNKIEGTKRFKELKDYLLTYNLLHQYFAPHSENKKYIALDSRYLGLTLGSRYLNGKNKFFNMYFNLEITGKKDNYTSAYTLTKEAKSEIHNYAKVIHKDKINKIVKSLLEDTYIESKVKNINNIKLKEVCKTINEYSIEIPLSNIKLVKSLYKKYPLKVQLILKNYYKGRLYYNKDYKPYGRNYSYIHTLPKELRKALFNGFVELDLESAAQSILLKEAKDSGLELKYLNKYVNNKDEIRKELMIDLDLNLKEVKKLLQVVTFNTRIPTKEQLVFFESFKQFPNSIGNEFIQGLSKDLSNIDEYLKDKLSIEDKETIIKFKGKLSNIDVRVFTFQSIESRIMSSVQSNLNEESFHLHDAIYVKSISKSNLGDVNKVVLNFEFKLSNIVLVFRKYTKAKKIKYFKIESIIRLRKNDFITLNFLE